MTPTVHPLSRSIPARFRRHWWKVLQEGADVALGPLVFVGNALVIWALERALVGLGAFDATGVVAIFAMCAVATWFLFALCFIAPLGAPLEGPGLASVAKLTTQHPHLARHVLAWRKQGPLDQRHLWCLQALARHQ